MLADACGAVHAVLAFWGVKQALEAVYAGEPEWTAAGCAAALINYGFMRWHWRKPAS